MDMGGIAAWLGIMALAYGALWALWGALERAAGEALDATFGPEQPGTPTTHWRDGL